MTDKKEPVAWFNGCDRMAVAALRFLATNDRPIGGEQTFNAAHLFQIADELERDLKRPLYTRATRPADDGLEALTTALGKVDASESPSTWEEAVDELIEASRSTITALHAQSQSPADDGLVAEIWKSVKRAFFKDASPQEDAIGIMCVTTALRAQSDAHGPDGLPVDTSGERAAYLAGYEVGKLEAADSAQSDAEVERIVAWLRKSVYGARRDAADLIEAGEHRKDGA